MQDKIADFQRRIQRDPYNPRPYVELARAYLEAGEEQKARELVVKRRKMPTKDVAVLHGWAEVCVALGMARMAEECYRDALRLAPQESETHYRLALLMAEVGHYEKSLRSLKKAVKHNPEHREARELLAKNYAALGLAGQAEALAPRKGEADSAEAPRYFPPSISDGDSSNFLRLFAGREVGYALQQLDAKTGEVSYAFQEAPTTQDLVAAHLLGEVTLAAFPMRSTTPSAMPQWLSGCPSRPWKRTSETRAIWLTWRRG